MRRPSIVLYAPTQYNTNVSKRSTPDHTNVNIMYIEGETVDRNIIII